jgi:2-oxoglutarate dehydrogenase E2 component (dihydrolipoamide succinyltransferase)
MAEIDILLPKMGESVAEATIIKWLVEEGQEVEADDPIVEIATDKVDSEVPAPEDGVIHGIQGAEGDVIQVGQIIAKLSTGGEAPAAPATAPAAEVVPEVESNGSNGVERPAPVEMAAASAPAPVAASGPVSKNGPSGRFYSPLVRSIAKEEGLGMGELEAIPGSGKDGRVTKTDVLGYLENRTAAPAPASNGQASAPAKPAAPAPAPAVSVGGQDEIVEMDRMRKLIADHMVMSKSTSPHVTSFVEADVTNMVMWRNAKKNDFLKNEGEKLTFTPLFVEAVVKAIKDYPGVNVSVDGNNIIFKKDINIGMATAMPNGNLIVPVIHNADQYNLVGLAKRVNDLANRARHNKLKPDEISGGTYTITNVGTFGNVMGTPIINQPQVGILAMGAIRKKPAVIETEHGDLIGIRHMLFLSHSYDHRVVDGMLGGSFVRRVADYLEGFDPNREV